MNEAIVVLAAVMGGGLFWIVNWALDLFPMPDFLKNVLKALLLLLYCLWVAFVSQLAKGKF